MRYFSWTILTVVELIFTVQAVVFKRYAVMKGTKVEGTGRTILHVDNDITCSLACENDVNCAAVNHNADGKICELLYKNTNELFTSTTAVGWTTIFNSLRDVDMLSNAVAFQSSAHDPGKSIASKAIDGNTDGIYDHDVGSCSHTLDVDSRWWMVDFQSQFSVSSVILWNRIDSAFWDRLRDLRVAVGNSIDALNNDYNLCDYYTGPPSSAQDNPVRINCSRVMFGRYLKIEKKLPEVEALTLCEVEVDQ